MCLIHAAKQALHDSVDRTGHDAALADFGQWALIRVPTQGVLAPDDSHAFTAIQEIAKRHLQLDVARAELIENGWASASQIDGAYTQASAIVEEAVAISQKDPIADPASETWTALASKHLSEGFNGIS